MTSIRYRHVAMLVCVAAALACAFDVRASEAKADFELQARVAELSPAGKAGGVVAQIQVFLEAFRSAHDIELQLEGSGGSAWRFKGEAVVLDRPAWTGLGGEPLEPGAEGVVVPSRGMILTTVAVPLEKTGPREIVLRATGTVEGRPVVATAVVRVVLAGDPGAVVDDGTYANFGLAEVK